MRFQSHHVLFNVRELIGDRRMESCAHLRAERIRLYRRRHLEEFREKT
jgi:hypothetical protein